MRSDLRERLDRQAAWQRNRAGRSWAEKLRAAVILRQTLLDIRKLPATPRRAGPPSQTRG
jgi:hypothetical protein